MADLVKYPPRPGDKEPYEKYLAPIDDELYERIWLATEKIHKETGVLHNINRGFAYLADQEYFWHCWQCCCCNNCNLAARPGSSMHELGLAEDLSNDPRNIPRSLEIFTEFAIIFPIWGAKPEPWHAQKNPNRAPLPDQPPILIPPKEQDMTLSANHVINGITLEAEIFTFPTLVRAKWNTAESPLWPANGYVSLVDYLPHSPGPTPMWVNHVEVGEIPGAKGPRFVIVCKDTTAHLACAAYQAEGNQGNSIIEFDLESGNPGHPGWWPAG